MDPTLLSAIGERNRLRIVELLNLAPRSVGEIADKLHLRQPQATKHLQSLERAGLVSVHPLGQRRIYALRRERLGELRQWLDMFAPAHPSEAVLTEYGNAIKAEAVRARNDPDFASGRTFRFAREFAAPAGVVWSYWTTGKLVRQWWSPAHFEVVRARVEPIPGGRLEIVIQEADRTRYVSRGKFIEVTQPTHLRFELGPVAPDGSLLLSAVYGLKLVAQRGRTKLSLTIRITAATPAAVSAVAGMRLGWKQLLDKLEEALAARNTRRSSRR